MLKYGERGGNRISSNVAGLLEFTRNGHTAKGVIDTLALTRATMRNVGYGWYRQVNRGQRLTCAKGKFVPEERP
jgi:hypothetical protein